MGKRTHTQRAGKGGPAFSRIPSRKAEVAYPKSLDTTIKGQVIDFVIDPVHTGVMAQIVRDDGKTFYTMAAEKIIKGQTIVIGKEAPIEIGNILPLQNIVEGCPIFGIEKVLNDGGSLVRGSALYGLIVSKSEK